MGILIGLACENAIMPTKISQLENEMKKITLLFFLMAYSIVTQAKEWTTIRIGVEPAYPPLSMKTAEGKLTGFDIDIANALCAQMKAKCTFVEGEFDTLIAGLNVRKFDAVVASMAIAEERKKMASFSDPYYFTPTRIIAKLGMIDGSEASLKGKRIGVLRGSVQHWYARDILAKSAAKIVPYSNQNETFLDLKAGRLDAVITDAIQGEYSFLKRPEGQGFGFVGPVIKDKRFNEGMGIAVRRSDDDLRQQFNKALKAIRANGVYNKVQSKYFSYDIGGH
jgi:arginine/ornithine transport system substrate-binding protein